MSMNNPAGRLLALMKKAQGIRNNEPAPQAWAKVLSGADEEQSEQHVVLERLGEVVTLPAQIRREIERLPDDIDHEFYLRQVKPFEDALRARIRFTGQWKNFKAGIKPEHMTGLEACDVLLARERPEPTLPDEVIKGLIQEFDELFKQVSEADLDADVREFLLTHIERMRHALQTYRISGVKPVIEALEGAVGAAVLQPDVTERVKATEEGDRFWKRMGRAFAALQAVQTAYQLVESVAKHLPMLGGG